MLRSIEHVCKPRCCVASNMCASSKSCKKHVRFPARKQKHAFAFDIMSPIFMYILIHINTYYIIWSTKPKGGTETGRLVPRRWVALLGLLACSVLNTKRCPSTPSGAAVAESVCSVATRASGDAVTRWLKVTWADFTAISVDIRQDSLLKKQQRQRQSS